MFIQIFWYLLIGFVIGVFYALFKIDKMDGTPPSGIVMVFWPIIVVVFVLVASVVVFEGLIKFVVKLLEA